MNNFKIIILLLLFFIQIFVFPQNDENEKIRNQILSKIDTLELAKLKTQIEIKDKSSYLDATQIMQSKGYPIKYTDSVGTTFELKGMLNGRPIYNKTYNRIAAQTTSTDDVWSSPFNLDGSGIEIGLWDLGAADEHHMSFREGSYGQKHVFFVDSTGSTINDHSTHVAGTIVADNDDYNSKGMAYKSIIFSMDSRYDETEMVNAASGNDPNFSVPLILSNHSYGVDVGWSWADHRGVGSKAWYWMAENYENEDPWFGDYNQITYDKDAIAYQAPYYTIVWAAGNDRGEGPEAYAQHYYWDSSQKAWVSSTSYHPKDGGDDGYDCLPPDAVCKNLITVGAIDDIVNGYQNSSNVKQDHTYFSVWGPTNDGRIKPDIVANGDSLYSTLPNNAFGKKSGTSMAAPNVTGAIALLLQHYKSTHSGYVPLSSTVKAILIHTADESGDNPGPDYKYGWGLLNTYKAAQLISTDQTKPTTIQEIDLPKEYGSQITFNNLYNDGTQPIKITLAWNDLPPVNMVGGPILMSDLDVRLTKDGITYYPYKLNPASPSSAATTGDNNKDNVEQIFLQSPGVGYYTVVVSHKGTLSTNQKFSLITTGFVEPFVTIFLKQIGNNNLPFGQASYWDNSMWNPVSDTTPTTLSLGKHHFLSTQDFKPSTYEKFNRWEDNLSNKCYRNWDTLTLKSTTTQVLSMFIPKSGGIVVKNSFDATNSSGGNIKFKDPWLIDFNEAPYGLRNQGMDAPFKQRPSPFYPDYTTSYNGDVYKGVFLNQGYDPQTQTWTPPYYSVKAEAMQSINLGGSLGIRDFYFQNWSRDYIGGQPSAEFQDSMALQTGVVFKQQNAVVKANLKGHLLSGATTGFSSNSQRKIVRTDDGKLHLVYESMGSVWYTISTDNGITWQPEQRVNPYSTYAKGVSIAQSDDGLNYVYIVYQIDREVFPNLSKGVVITQYHYGVQQWANTVYSLSTYDYDTKPVVAAQNNVAYVVFKPTSSSQLRAAKVSSSGVVYTSFALNNTTSGSVNPSLAAAVQNFYLAYQNNSTEIRYFKFSVNGSISDYAVVSSHSGFTYNINPSLSTHAGDPVISWSGYTSSIPTIVIRRKSGGTWSTFKQCSNGSAAYPSNNNSRSSSSAGTVIAWTNMYNQSQYIKFVNGEYSTIKTLPYSGQDIQIGNGNEFDQLKAVTFNRSGSAPYGINPLQYNFNTMQKTTTEEDFNYARIAVIGKENAEIVYGLGDIKLNNENILFTRLNDMVQINNTQDLSSAMKTENFVLSKESKLEFSDCAYVINGDSVNLTASEILPIIELVNLSNGQALKVKDISISIKDTIDEKTYYVLNCSYLPEGTYYLRVNLDTEEQYEYNISDCIYEENEQLKKKDYKEIVLENNLLPKEFSLEQNYPNPFNPSTTIKYQIPASLNPSKGGTLVTLKVCDILGKEVATLVNEEKDAGYYEVKFDASLLASGVYIYKLQAGDFVSSKKMILLK